MQSKAKLLGHPVHPMLITFPLGLLPTAVIFDVVAFVKKDTGWNELSYWMIAAGIVGALVAAVFGLIDWLAIPSGTRAKRIGTLHGGGNLIVVALFAVSWWLRHQTGHVPTYAALVCAFVGLGLAVVTAWLGGELVDRLGVGVDDGANLDAESSLSEPTVVHHEPHPYTR